MTNDHGIIIEFVDGQVRLGGYFVLKRPKSKVYIAVFLIGVPINKLEIANFVVRKWLWRRSRSEAGTAKNHPHQETISWDLYILMQWD
jgi:hypothetical protein